MDKKQLSIDIVGLAGALHDIGKMAVGNEILEKPDKLTDEEFDKMKNHVATHILYCHK
jgi:HD-GYP domain-containing protein (c-di-GMP phosphodiesterase class II)